MLFDEHIGEGLGANNGVTQLSAWCARSPESHRDSFPHARRAIRAWRRLRPKHSRHPLPWDSMCGIATFVVFGTPGGTLATIASLLMFDLYLRQYVLLGMEVQDFLWPTHDLRHCTVAICPQEMGRPSKTTVFDDRRHSTTCSGPNYRNLFSSCSRTFVEIRDREPSISPTANLRASSSSALNRGSSRCAPARRGGPSENRAVGTRTEGEIAKRGRWLCTSALRRHEQRGNLHVVLACTP